MIAMLCNKLKIINYTINEDSTIDVDGDVNISKLNLKIIPIGFRKVTGTFRCDDNLLESLCGCPIEVGHDFSCINNNLITLIGCPTKIGNNFFCHYNKLTSLLGAPDIVSGNFYFGYNPGISQKTRDEYFNKIGMVINHLPIPISHKISSSFAF